MYQTILAEISDNTLVLTANRRLSRRLIAEHDQMPREASVWQTLRCLPLQSWLKECWIQALIKGDVPPLLLLNESQEQFIWEHIVSQTNNPLLNVQATAQQVHQAWQLTQDYQLSLDETAFRYTDASQQFTQWSRIFEKHCDKHKFLDTARLLSTIIKLIKQEKIKLPKKIIFIGFLDQYPLLEKFIDELKQQTTIEIISPIQTDTTCQTQQTVLPNTSSEIFAMATWAKLTLEKQPKAKIACIIPELTTLRTMANRLFSSTLNDNQYNISGGNSLLDEPIIFTALLVLKLSKSLRINDASYLLRSPFIGAGESERDQRALLDASLREDNHLSLSLKQLISAAKHCYELKKYLLAYADQRDYQKQSAHKWAKIFSKQLAVIGWPGDRSLNSREHQAIKQWQLLLENFANLEAVEASFSINSALKKLTQLASQQLFQVQTNDDAPIQVLGLLETVGLSFDHAWLMGLDDQHWPNTASPNPYLPINLQRQHNMPHANAERELAFARQIQSMLQTQVQQLILSYPQQEDDRTLMPSRLLDGFQSIHVMIPAPSVTQANKLETLKNDKAPATSENEKIRGGSGIFKQQAACPFRAFAQYRLQADTIIQPELGLTAAERGILVHQALEIFWQQVRSHKQLCALSEALLEQTLNNLIRQAIEDQIGALQLPARLLETEQQRLLQLLKRWLSIERSREPFTVIAEERWQSITVGGIPLRLQIDRIDRLQDGSHIIIDYKTGLTNLMSWFGDRPDDLQLPLYATSNRKNLSGLYFAQIRADKMAFKGLSQIEGQLPGAKTLNDFDDEKIQRSWHAQLDDWQSVLEQLGKDFHAGSAEIDPKYPVLTCQYCNFHTLCRIHEQ